MSLKKQVLIVEICRSKHSRKGYLVFYGLIIMVIAGLYLSGLRFTALDQSLSNRYAQIEVQARLSAETGLEICRQIATSTCDQFGSFTINLSSVGIDPSDTFSRYISSLTVFYSTTEALASIAYASVTAFLRHEAGSDSWPLGRRSAWNMIDVTSKKFVGRFSFFPLESATFTYLMGGAADDVGSCLRMTSDGGIIQAGYSNSNDGDFAIPIANATDGIIVRYSATGSILFRNTFGGTANDGFFDARQTIDGGAILVGFTESNDGSVLLNQVWPRKSGRDFWAVKIDQTGNAVWNSCFGGSGNETAYAVTLASDGSFIIVGKTDSNDFDVSGYKGGTSDGWVIQVASNGTLIRQKCLGGLDLDELVAVSLTGDDGVFVLGTTRTNNAIPTDDIEGFHGGESDIWGVRLDATLNPVWKICLGGLATDTGAEVVTLADGSFLIIGSSNSLFSSSHGDFDAYIARVSSTGVLFWETTCGGTLADFGFSVRPIRRSDKTMYIFAGQTFSSNGDVTSVNHGNGDGWLVKLAAIDALATPTVEWSRCYGGSQEDYFRSIYVSFDEGFFIAGTTSSNDFDVAGSHGGKEIWILKADSEGNF